MAEFDPGKNRGRKSMGLRNVEVGLPQDHYDALERWAGRGNIAHVIRMGVECMLNGVDDPENADMFPLRWLGGVPAVADPGPREFRGLTATLDRATKGSAPKRVIPAKLDPDAAKMLEAIRVRPRSGRTLANDLGMDIMTAADAISVLIGAGLVMRGRNNVLEAV